MASDLDSQGLRCKVTDHVSSKQQDAKEPDMESIRAFQRVMGRAPPIVFINGWAKSNPTVEEVLREYKKSAEKG